jgi:serine/threonine-protein kinase
MYEPGSGERRWMVLTGGGAVQPVVMKNKQYNRMRGAMITVVMVVMTGPVHGQTATAQAEILFRQGKELMAAGKLAQACAAFDASQRLDPTTPTLLNQANCREHNGQLATAWGLYLEVAQNTHAGSDKASQQMYATATERAARLESRLSTLRVDVAQDPPIAGLELLRNGERLDPATWNQRLPIDGGTYRIVARAPGKAAWSGTVVVAAERDAQTIAVPALPSAPGIAVPDEPRHVAGTSSLVSADVDPGAGWSTRRKIALVATGAAVIAVAAGSVLGVRANRKQRDAHAACPDPEAACDSAELATELNRSGHNLAIGANLAFGAGAAAAIVAGVLWFTGAPEPHRGIAFVPAATPESIVIAWRGRF